MKKLLIAASVVTLLSACSGMGDMMGMGDKDKMDHDKMDHSKMSMEKDKMGMAMGKESVVMVGGAPMYPTKDIIDNAVNSKDHTTLVAAVKAAGLVETLKGPGPFTVFAPTNAAFDALPAGTVDTLLKPQNKPMLVKILTAHVVPGRLDAAALQKQIVAGGGRTSLTTASGDTLVVSMRGNDVIVTDEKGGSAKVTIANVYQSNGVIHVVDHVLVPN